MWRLLAKGGVSVLLIWLLLRERDLGALLRQMLAVEPGHLALAAAVLWLLAIPSALRWSTVLGAMGHRLAFRNSFPIVLVGLFFNLTLPSSVGGDAVRMWQVHRAGLPGAAAIMSVMIDRLVALVAILLLVLAALPLMYAQIPDRAARGGVVLLLALGFLGFAVALAVDRLPAALERLRPARAILQLTRALRAVMLTPRASLPSLAYSLMNQGGVVVVVTVLAEGLHLPVTWLQSLLIVPITILVTVLPISVAGWGVREGAFVAGFGLVGVPAADALALSVLFGLLNTLVCLPGGLVWLALGGKRQPRAEPTA
jgi:uncharacterized membrane protein YbhN (UPF0104 family)